MISPDRRKEIRERVEAQKEFDPQREAQLRLFANQNIPGATYGFANVPLMDSISDFQFDAKNLPYQDVLDGVNIKGIGLKNFGVTDGNIVDKVFDARLKALNNDKSAGELAVIRHMKDWGLNNNAALVTFLETGILQPGVSKDTLLEAYDYGLRQDAKHMQTKPKGFFKSLLKGNIGAIAGLALAPFTGGASIAAGVAAQNLAEGDNPFTRIGEGELPFTSVEAEIAKDLIQGTKKGLSRNKGLTDPSFLSNVGEATSITAPKGSDLYNAQIAANQRMAANSSSAGSTNAAMPTRREYTPPTYPINTIQNALTNTSIQPESDPVIRDLNVLFNDPYYRRAVTSTPGDPTGNAPALENITRLFQFPGMQDPQLGEDIVKRALYIGELVNPYLKAGGTPGSVAEAMGNQNEENERKLKDLLNPLSSLLMPNQLGSSGSLNPFTAGYSYRFDPVRFSENPNLVNSLLTQQTNQNLPTILDYELADLLRQTSRG
ncbi:hypothetical protein [uncultured Mediterranean phage uvMED]|nr:hypothetical protein [uncultured Mediterranean phage uvMED]BAQ88911.1 hypothetical protein [uncultured Mediterranean phage uvMED]